MASHSSPSASSQSDSPTPIQGAQALEAARLRAGVPTATRSARTLMNGQAPLREYGDRVDVNPVDGTLTAEIDTGAKLSPSERRALSGILAPIAQAFAAKLDRRVDIRVCGHSLGYGIPLSELAPAARYKLVFDPLPPHASRYVASAAEFRASCTASGRQALAWALELQSRGSGFRPCAIVDEDGVTILCVEALP